MKLDLAKESQLLIAEDQPLAKSHMKYALEQLGFQHVDYVDRASHAITALSKQHYDAVICAYDLREDHGGYGLFEQLRAKRTLPLTTGFVFTSADTSADVVHAIIELQPDEFLAKPFSVNQLDKRLFKVLRRKKVLFDIYEHMDRGNFEDALEAIDEFLIEPRNADYFPLALKTKGDLLLLCQHYHDAKDFFEAVINVQDFAWARFGLSKCYVQLEEFDNAEKTVLELAFNRETMLPAYDLLSELKIKEHAYDDALECVTVASDISPRNISRHQKAHQLSRITHDYKSQFDSAKKVVRYGKDSIHDTPDIYLAAARAGVDFAMTADAADTNNIIKQTNDYLRQLKTAHPKAKVDEQLHVINARLCYLQNDSDKAKAMMEALNLEHWEDKPAEELIDTAKAFHEVGLQGNSIKILETLELKQANNGDKESLLSQYIKQEKTEKATIVLSPRSLNNAAVLHYQKGELAKSFEVFHQAFKIMPKNPAIALNLLQAIIGKHGAPQGDAIGLAKLIKRCRYTIENATLSEEQKIRYENIKGRLLQVA